MEKKEAAKATGEDEPKELTEEEEKGLLQCWFR